MIVSSSAVQFLRSDVLTHVLCLAGLMCSQVYRSLKERRTRLFHKASLHTCLKNIKRGSSVAHITRNFYSTLTWSAVCLLNTFTWAIIKSFQMCGHSMEGKNPPCTCAFFSIKSYLKSLWNAAGKWNLCLLCRADVALLSFWTMCVGGAEESQHFSDSIWAVFSTP